MPRPLFILSAATLAMTGASASLQADETLRGRVQSYENGHVNACFYGDDAPARGEEFDVVRNVLVSAPKHETRTRLRRVGVIRIERPEKNGCAPATMVSGQIRVSDWIAPQPKS